MTRQTLASAVLFYATLPSVRPVIWSGSSMVGGGSRFCHEVHHLLASITCNIRPAAMCTGEAFDKIARLLGLDLRPNGGAALEAFAKRGDPHRYPFTVPLRRNNDCNFSYAGLKNSVRLAIQAEAPGEATAANEQVCNTAHSPTQFMVYLHPSLKTEWKKHTHLLTCIDW